MSGEFTTGETHNSINNIEARGTQGENPGKVETDLPGVFADAEKNGMPVFDVDKETFNNNMRQERRRLRFKTGTAAAQYHQGSKYNRPFWLRSDGYLRKVDK
jgi:hypothetical protein